MAGPVVNEIVVVVPEDLVVHVVVGGHLAVDLGHVSQYHLRQRQNI